MTKEQYLQVMGWIRAKKYGVPLIKWSGKGITYLTAFVYAMEILVLLWRRDLRVIPYIVVPGISFLWVSVFRSCYGAVRPYEQYGFEPLVPKATQAKSFPSRHVFSLFVIAAVTCFIHLPIGVFLLFLGVVMAALRVVMGVHFPGDVLAGSLMGIVGGCVGMGIWMLY